MDHYSRGDLMVCTGITLDSRTHLSVFERGTVTAVRYRNEVLEPYVFLFTVVVSPDFILRDCNTMLHIHLVVEFLKSEDIHCMEWPVRSPDLMPIKHA
ncbi:transposable element Tc1 transposase [Trichonephila clavipes]|nr:transposable element Tc1 transposase [Trichonephila clavipes]